MTAPAPGTEGQPRAIDPARSACVLIGVDAYTELEPLRSVRRNLTELEAVLTDESIWGISSERITKVENPQTAFELVESIRKAALLATDTLIVYYAGHGLLDQDEADLLCLTLPDSAADRLETAVRDADVRRAMRDCSAERRVLLLDCCYSARIMKGQMAVADRGARASKTLKGVRGAYVMTSSSGDRKSLAPDPKKCSAFTGEFVGVLREGVADGPEMLGLHAIFDAVREWMGRRQLPQPQEPHNRDDGGIGHLPFVRNLAVAPPPPPQPAEPDLAPAPPGRWSRWSLAAGMLVLGVIAGLAVPPARHLWHTASPQQAGGACSKRATLLSYSDALDKRQVSGEPVSGLSALALTGHDEAMALTDNAPGRIFPLHLGAAEKLEKLRPQARRATTLRARSGVSPSQWFDGEGLVIERGGKSILVASETGPAIRRFRRDTGKQVGKALPIPKEFRATPEGEAQAGRTIESLTASQDGRYLYAAMEGPLSRDGDARGRNLLRIQRYRGTPGGDYEPDRQYAYQTGEGMYLVELAAVGDKLLALERQYVVGLGNAIRVYTLSLRGAANVEGGKALYDEPADAFVQNSLLFDLARCPAGDPGAVPTRAQGQQVNPLLQNVEGMAVGKLWTKGPYKGRRPLYLISDDNKNGQQITRLYALSVRVP